MIFLDITVMKTGGSMLNLPKNKCNLKDNSKKNNGCKTSFDFWEKHVLVRISFLKENKTQHYTQVAL